MEVEASSFGVKLFDAQCKVLIPPQPIVDALAEIWTLGLTLKPVHGKTVYVPYTEATKVETSNYRASVTTSADAVTITQLGIKYDQFAEKLVESWSDALENALLMHEPDVVYEAPATYSQFIGGSQISGQCRARIYQTALVILPSDALPRRVPFSSISAVNLEGYTIKISTAAGTIELSRLGPVTQFFVDKLTEAMRGLEASSIETIRSMLPSITYDELRKLSSLMLEGRGAPRRNVEEISPDLWKKLEKSVELSPLAESYGYICSLGEVALSSIGLRKTMGVVYAWFLIPVEGSVQSGGNALVMEITSETGHATYLFRVMSRTDFPNASQERFVQESETLAHNLNEAIIATGFRREPIYLSDDKLNSPSYAKYLYAANHLEPLKLLRERFFARIIHHNFEQWKSDLSDALIFNTKVTDETNRWSNGTDDSNEIET